MRPESAHPRPGFPGEYYYDESQDPVDVVMVTPLDYLDYVLDAPTKALGSHMFHDVAAPCALGGAFSFPCPAPGVQGWPSYEDSARFELGRGWLVSVDGGAEVPVNLANHPAATHSFRRPGPGGSAQPARQSHHRRM